MDFLLFFFFFFEWLYISILLIMLPRNPSHIDQKKKGRKAFVSCSVLFLVLQILTLDDTAHFKPFKQQPEFLKV